MTDLRSDLYNKLWENINSNQNSVWTLLSLFFGGTGIVIVNIDSSDHSNLGLYFLVLLGSWMVHLIVNAEWWGVRNRLMISTVEVQPDTKLISSIPSGYLEIQYNPDNQSNINLVFFSSILIFLSVFVFTRAFSDISTNEELDQIQFKENIFVAIATFITINTNFIYLSEHRIKRVISYHGTASKLNKNAIFNSPTPKNIANSFKSVRSTLIFCPVFNICLFFVIIFIFPDQISCFSETLFLLIFSVICQSLIFILYTDMWRNKRVRSVAAINKFSERVGASAQYVLVLLVTVVLLIQLVGVRIE